MANQVNEFIARVDAKLASIACEAALATDAAAAAEIVHAGAQAMASMLTSIGRDDLGEVLAQIRPEVAASAEQWVSTAQKAWERWKASIGTDAAPASTESAAASLEAPSDGDRDLQIERDVESLKADPEMASMFFAEAHDHLALIEASVLELEGRPDDTKLLNDIFRSYHTIKGNAGVVAVKSIQEFAHRVENLLDHGRSGRIAIGPEAIDVILKSIDLLGAVLSDLTKRLAGEAGASNLQQRLVVMATVDRLLKNNGAAGEATTPTHAAEPTSATLETPVAPPVAVTPVTAAAVAAASAPAPAPEPAAVAAPPPPAVQASPTPAPAAAPTPAAASTPKKKEAAAEAPNPGRRADDVAQASVKVDTRKLDNLVDTVGELVIVQSIISEDPRLQAFADERLTRNLAQLGRITSELQRNAMSMRMVPIRQTFQKMARLVRDLSKKSGKPVDLVLSGEDTELDRKVVEDINDPLMHMIRNSADHGIEPNDVRRSLGKTLPAQLRLSAFHQGGNIVITIADDGAGLNTEKILAKAVAQGLVAPGATLPPAEIHQLIFKPGFSTADKVTEISGRGVGMDVVRRNIEALRGRIDIQTEKGRGTSFSIKLPLTLAILEGLVLRVGTERYVLPTFSVRESLRPSADQIQLLQGQPRMIQVRGSLLPLAWLADLIGVEGATHEPTEATVVVVEDDGKYLALLVDELVGKQEVVIKSLGDTFKQVRGIAGGAILGDGRIGLILDASGVAGMLSRASSYVA